jgi:hypothetical protein
MLTYDVTGSSLSRFTWEYLMASCSNASRLVVLCGLLLPATAAWSDVYPLPLSCGPITLEQTAWEGSVGAQFGLGCMVAFPSAAPTGGLKVARGFDAPETGLAIACVHAPIYVNSAPWPVTASIWLGHPTDPPESLALVSSITLEAPVVELQEPLTLSFDFGGEGVPPLAAGQAFFVELSVASRDPEARGDGGSIYFGCRSAAQTAPTYAVAPECGFESWFALANPTSSALIRVEGSEPTSSCLADLNDDGVVDATDLALLLGAWGRSGSSDLNADNIVNAADLAVLLGAWGSCG